jgi:hypothetical protein
MNLTRTRYQQGEFCQSVDGCGNVAKVSRIVAILDKYNRLHVGQCWSVSHNYPRPTR